MVGLVVIGGLAATWLLRAVAGRILRHDDRRPRPSLADEAEAWLRGRGPG